MSHGVNAPLVRILVVDDEPGILGSYREILLRAEREPQAGALDATRASLFGTPNRMAPSERFDVVFSSGAEDAVQAAQDAIAEGRPFGIVFLDMRMPPGRDGLWAANRIHDLDPSADIVIVTACSDVTPDEIHSGMPATASPFYVQKPFHAHEILQLARALGGRRQSEERIRHLAFYDTTTGLPNRAFFRDRLVQTLDLARRSQRPLALLFLDLDNFKRINDTLGHSIGDLLLSETGKRLGTRLRTSDAITRGRADMLDENVAHLGGDEFSVLLSEIHQGTNAGTVAKRILDAVCAPICIGGHDITVTASIGIAVFPEDGTEADTLLKCADLAMYDAKREGRNTFKFFTESMNAAAQRRLAVESCLRRAVERGELSLAYQPQLNVATGEVSSLEALLRWESAELGTVSPAEFIPIAEETGLILPIGEWVMRTACTQGRAWRDAGISLERIAVNVSVNEFVRNDFVPQVGRILEETGLDAGSLEIEITETVLMKDGESALATLRALHSLGVQIAIDDFGTGYSSLAYLKQFPINRLKIDRSFVSAAHTDERDRAIVRAVIAMAESLDLDVTAEGVENEGQLKALRDLRCGLAQGYYLGRPLPSTDTADYIREHRKPRAA